MKVNDTEEGVYLDITCDCETSAQVFFSFEENSAGLANYTCSACGNGGYITADYQIEEKK